MDIKKEEVNGFRALGVSTFYHEVLVGFVRTETAPP